MTQLPARPLTRLLAAGLAAAALMALPALSVAQSSDRPNDNAKIMLHLVPASGVGGNPCRSSKAIPTCDLMKVAGNLLEPYYAYLVVTDGSTDSGGIAGVEFGIKYNTANGSGVDIDEWQSCGDVEYNLSRDWYRQRNNGNMVTWSLETRCQSFEPSGPGTGVTAVAGYFYLTAQTPDRLEVTERSVSRQAAVADCFSQETIVSGHGVFRPRSHLGFVEFSDRAQTPGYNPCGLAKPVLDSTWGGVKAGTGSGN